MQAGKEFSDLKIWQKGYTLLLRVYELTAHFPNGERFDLTSQLRRSANSIIANIAEAHGRYYFADKVRVLYQSRGEAIEVRSHLHVARGLAYIDDATFAELDHEYEGLSVGINAYIKSIQQAAKKP